MSSRVLATGQTSEHWSKHPGNENQPEPAFVFQKVSKDHYLVDMKQPPPFISTATLHTIATLGTGTAADSPNAEPIH